MDDRPDVPETLRPALAELEAYLVGLPPERLADHVLVLASTWTLADAGLDLDRLAQDARQFRQTTPEHDRVLASFPDAIASYLVYRMMMSDDDELEPAVAAERLAQVRAALELRAAWVEDDFPLVAEGFRRLLAETAGGAPPYDR